MIDRAELMNRRAVLEKATVILTGIFLAFWWLNNLIINALGASMIGLIGITLSMRNFLHLRYVQAIFDDIYIYTQDQGSNKE